MNACISSDQFARRTKILPLGLVSNPTRTLACAANNLYFLCSLGSLSAASLLARDRGACAARPGLVAEKGEPPRTPSIYATDTWSGRVGEAKYKRRDANDNKRGCKVRNAKCEMGARLQLRMQMWMRCLPVPVSHLPYIFFFLLSNLSLFLSWAPSETRSAMSEWQLGLASASFSSLPDYPSVKLTSIMSSTEYRHADLRTRPLLPPQGHVPESGVSTSSRGWNTQKCVPAWILLSNPFRPTLKGSPYIQAKVY